MRSIFGCGIFALAATALIPPVTATSIHIEAPAMGRPLLCRRRGTSFDCAPLYRRSRGPQAKPAKKPNRVRMGRRVRRKHRRAA